MSSQQEVTDPDEYAFEMKWDGVRTVAYLAGDKVKLLSRRGRDDTAAYFDVADALTALAQRRASRPRCWTARSS